MILKSESETKALLASRMLSGDMRTKVAKLDIPTFNNKVSSTV